MTFDLTKYDFSFRGIVPENSNTAQIFYPQPKNMYGRENKDGSFPITLISLKSKFIRNIFGFCILSGKHKRLEIFLINRGRNFRDEF